MVKRLGSNYDLPKYFSNNYKLTMVQRTFLLQEVMAEDPMDPSCMGV